MIQEQIEQSPASTGDAAADLASEDAAFESGFTAEQQYAPPPADEPAVDADQTPAAAGTAAAAAPAAQGDAANAAVDPYAGLPDEVRTQLARIPGLEHDVASNRGRVAALNRELESARGGKAAQASAAAAPATQERVEAVEKVRGELPEVADAIEAAVAAALRKPAAQAQTSTQGQTTSTGSSDEDDPEVATLASEYPAWADTMVSEQFKLWLTTQPSEYRSKVMASSSAAVVIGALGKFEVFKTQASAAEQLAARRTGRAAAAAIPQGKAKPAATTSTMSEEDAFNAGFTGG
jgi:hypothetical protein